MTVLGTSASGHAEAITSEAVKAVLEATGLPYEYLSLAGLQIGGCLGRVRCGADNRCAVKDDWPAVGEMMLAAEAIVFGAPNYYGSIDALAHACLERTFCFRHREVFALAGKLGVAVAVDGGALAEGAIPPPPQPFAEHTGRCPRCAGEGGRVPGVQGGQDAGVDPACAEGVAGPGR